MAEQSGDVITSEVAGRMQLCAPVMAWEVRQARIDESIVTGVPLTEKPWWFQEVGPVGRQYYDIRGCLGWPETDYLSGQRDSGAGVIVGVLKRSGVAPEAAEFLILDEVVDDDPAVLLARCDTMRKKWGYGLRHDFLTAFTGNPIGRERVVQVANSVLPDELSVIEPVDNQLQEKKRFDRYVMSILQLLGANRLFFGGNELSKEAVRRLMPGDPIVTAIGGLCHTMVATTSWMETMDSDGAFIIDDAGGTVYAGV